MDATKRPVNKHKAYHAHVYFDRDSLQFASGLCAQASELFGLQVGRVHQRLVGPHPRWSCQISFASKHFADFIAWLDNHRNGLTILVHGLTGDDLQDHTEYAYWLGKELELNLALFKRN
ncbi:MAG: DOPA 4,5-dioxygenase family protein [Spongiibacteraceae bacterium]